MSGGVGFAEDALAPEDFDAAADAAAISICPNSPPSCFASAAPIRSPTTNYRRSTTGSYLTTRSWRTPLSSGTAKHPKTSIRSLRTVASLPRRDLGCRRPWQGAAVSNGWTMLWV